MVHKRARARISGRVQGVSYRASTRDVATRLGLTGWVKNLSDGSVELEAEGEASAVDDLVVWLRRGPVGAFVADVEIHWTAPTGAEQEFEIRFR